MEIITAILNMLLVGSFLIWFWNHFVISRKKMFIGIILLFLLSSFLLFTFLLLIRHEYLDGVHFLIASGVSVTVFWICTMAIIIWKNIQDKTTQRTCIDLLQVTPLLLIPLLTWLLLSTMTLKIGG